MRHNVKTKTLGRTAAHRRALLRNLADSLILHEKIETTLTKAKYVRPYVEQLVTKAKKDKGFNTVKYLKTKLVSEEAVRKLLEEVSPRFLERMGGYTRVVKTRNRDGDNSVMARIEFTEKKKKEASTAKSKAKKVTKEVKEVKEVEEKNEQ